MKTILIDTEAILDFFFDREPYSADAAKVLSLCESREIKTFITSVILNYVYYLLRQHSTHEKVIEKLKLLITITEALITNKESIQHALNSSFKDFEDALQNYSAVLNGRIDIIITRNIKDFMNSSLGIMTPSNYLKTLIANR